MRYPLIGLTSSRYNCIEHYCVCPRIAISGTHPTAKKGKNRRQFILYCPRTVKHIFTYLCLPCHSTCMTGYESVSMMLFYMHSNTSFYRNIEPVCCKMITLRIVFLSFSLVQIFPTPTAINSLHGLPNLNTRYFYQNSPILSCKSKVAIYMN